MKNSGDLKIDNFALIIGAMKCGTTSLYSYLSQHPEIATAKFKEPNFFSYDERWEKGFDWYLDRWETWNKKQHKIALEASINYTKYREYPRVIERITSLQDRANFKFIYIVRNPYDRIESHYTHAQVASWGEGLKDLEAGIDRQLIETSKYASQIERYYAAFPSENILLLNFAELKNRPQAVLQKICSFLDIDPSFEFQALGKVYNPNQARVIDGKIWLSLKNNNILKSAQNLISAEQKKKLRRILGGKKVDGNFKLSPEQRRIVFDSLKEDLNKLRDTYNIDISQWKV